MKRARNTPLPHAFENSTLRISLEDIKPLRELRSVIRKSAKYRQIAASIIEVGIIEPPVVVPDPIDDGKFRLLDGHIRLVSVVRTFGTDCCLD